MKQKVKKVSKWILAVVLAYVIVLVGGFFGIKYGLTNTAGIVDGENNYFQKSENQISRMQKVEGVSTENAKVDQLKNLNDCQIAAIGQYYPANAQKIIAAYQETNSDPLIAKMILAVDLRMLDNPDFQKKYAACQTESYAENNSESLDTLAQKFPENSSQNVFPWMNRSEWQTIAAATIKDKDAIDKAGKSAGVEPRMIVACMIVEQLRLFNSEREVFKKVFEPLKILGNADQISLGVMGVKQQTAEKIENNLKDQSSPYYLGQQYEHLLDYLPGTTDINQARFARLTDESDNHYYSYLYGALYLREMLEQWRRSGFNIQYRMEIVGTLFNVGFPQSKPNPDPKVGGSSIDVGDGKYSFGSLAYEFYYSGELTDEFPYK
ncbi:MAG: hypothetical protein P4L62_00110 [Candidatus Pacebacteria bacterium]|nr:hypothetical protein [Candidatus Paceibacterota bacterium]